MLLITATVLITSLHAVSCWSQAELDLFDLVEEIGENFYDVLQVTQYAETADIRRAYRKLSLQYHPDKNPDPNATDTFRKIGAVADVLKDEELRKMYDDILANGLPDWRQPVYYYRRVRKMGLLELLFILLVVITIGQFVLGWASYLEKKLVLWQLLDKKEKKDRKQKGRSSNRLTQLDMEVLYYDHLANASLPHYRKLLPFLLVTKTISGVVALYRFVRFKLKQPVMAPPPDVADDGVCVNEHSDKKSVRQRGKSNKRQSKTQGSVSTSTSGPVSTSTSGPVSTSTSGPVSTSTSGPVSSESDNAMSSNNVATDKEPSKEFITPPLPTTDIDTTDIGTNHIDTTDIDTTDTDNGAVNVDMVSDDAVSRPSKTKHSIKQARSNRIPDLSRTLAVPTSASHDQDESYNDKQAGMNVAGVASSSWSQFQQTQLERALKQYTREMEQRWELIAAAVPGKSTSECKLRYRELAEAVRQKKKLEQ